MAATTDGAKAEEEEEESEVWDAMEETSAGKNGIGVDTFTSPSEDRHGRGQSELQRSALKKSHLRSTVVVAPVTVPPKQPLPVIPIWIKDWTMTVIIGAFTASHWRGLWTLLDLWTCTQPEIATLAGGENFCYAATFGVAPETDGQARWDSAVLTYWLGCLFTVLGVVGVWFGLWTPPPDCNGKVTITRAIIRWFVAYTLCVAAVCQWRGIWYMTDQLILLDYPLQSYWTTTVAGAGAAFLMISGGALLAPPAIFLLDGPGLFQPPIAVTIMSSYYSVKLEAGSIPPERSPFLLLLDALVSFFGLPWMVVWYWRGCWLLQDWYFWGLTPIHQDVLNSLGWSTLLAFVCFFFASEPVMSFMMTPIEKCESTFLTAVMGRLRTLVLAIGCVAFWRVIWSLWDLNGTSHASAWASEVVSVFCVTAMGCLTSLTAPPSTLGVDVTPNPKCADEPLFAMVPVPWELLTWFGIARTPKVIPVDPNNISELELAAMSPQIVTEHDVDRSAGGEEEEEGEKGEARDKATPMRQSLGQSLRSSGIGGLGASLSMSMSSLRESLSESVTLSYLEAQRPSMEMQEVWIDGNAFLQQRPSSDNIRHRSSFFRNR